jgi:hypothetical protein
MISLIKKDVSRYVIVKENRTKPGHEGRQLRELREREFLTSWHLRSSASFSTPEKSPRRNLCGFKGKGPEQVVGGVGPLHRRFRSR